MAGSADQKTEFIKVNDLDEKFLTCEICANLYKRPRILLCHHTFCQECLEEWAKVNRGRELTCPNCRQPWQVPVGGVEKLSANYYVNSLIDFVVNNRKAITESNGMANSEKCEYCESKAATSACLECSQLTCDDCAKVHKRMRLSAGHQIVSLEDYRANYENQSAKLKPSECDRHPGTLLKYYCQTCSVPICSECTIIEHRIPEHQHIYLSEAAREARSFFNGTLIQVKDRLECYAQNVANIKQVKERLTDFKDHAILETEKHTEDLMIKIRKNERENVKRINDIFVVKTKVLDSQIDRIELAKGQVKSSFDHSKNLVELGTDAGLMSVHKQTYEMLEALLSEEIQVEPQVNHHLQYSANPAFATGQQGSVTDSKAVSFQSVVKHKQPYAIVRNKALFQLVTNDMHGNELRQGGAEVMAEVTTENGERVASEVADNANGTYDIAFTPTKPGTHWLSVSLLGQPVKDSPIKVSCLSLLCLQTTKVIGSQGTGPGLFDRPLGVAVSKVNDIYVAECDNSRIQVFDYHGEYQRHFTVDRRGKRVKPWDIAFTREDNLLITDWNGKQVCVCDTGGRMLRWFGKGELKNPRGVAVGKDGHIHVADWVGDCVKTFTPEGGLVRTIGGCGDQPGQLNHPYGVTVNSKDQIIVSDWGNHRVQVFDSSGAFLFAFGRQGEREGELKLPRGMVVDQHDNIIVCDSGNNRIVMFSAEGDYMGRVDDPNDEVKGPNAITTMPGQPLKVIVTESKHVVRIM